MSALSAWRAGSTGRRWATLLLVPVILACDSGTEPELVGSIMIASVDERLATGSSVQLVVTVLSASGSVLSGHPLTWSSTQDAIASVSPTGLVRALTPGTATIRATAGAKSATVSFTVWPGECVATMTAGSIAPGQSRSGALGPAACTIFDSPAEGWDLRVTTTTGIRIVMTSGAYNGALLLTNRQMDPLMWSDWPPDAVQLTAQLPPGDYIVWAHSWDDNPSGGYQLAASAVQLCEPSAAAGTVTVGGTISGSLGASDCLFFHGVSADGYRLDLGASQGLRIDLTSSSFDGLLVVTDLHMNLLWWDSGGLDGTGARIQRHLGAGSYLVWATSPYSATGDYQLAVSAFEISLCPTVGTLERGTTVTGELSSSDCRPDGHRFGDPWQLTLSAQTTLRIDLTSNEFDTYLVVEDASGGLLAADDDGGGDLNSRLVYTFPAGEYRIIATSYDADETGVYQLSAREASSRATAGLAAPWANAGPPWMKRGVR